ncbi:MAG: thioredoxin family protein [bacterium]
MKSSTSISLLLFLLGLFPMMGYASLGKEKVISDFRLPNVDGKNISLSNYPDAKGFIVVFTCNHCPFAKLYPTRLKQLQSQFAPLGIPLIAISSTDTSVYEDDGFDQMVARSKTQEFNFPYLYDLQQDAAKDFGAKRTPHAFVIWKQSGKWVIKYSGAIDDNGAEPEKVTHRYVVDAVNELLKGSEVHTRITQSIGCQIHFRTSAK